LSSIVQRMLAKDPRQRPQTPAEVVEALAPWTASPIPPPSASEMPSLSPAVRGQTPEGDPAGPQTPSPRPGPWSRALTASTPVPPMPGPPRQPALPKVKSSLPVSATPAVPPPLPVASSSRVPTRKAPPRSRPAPKPKGPLCPSKHASQQSSAKPTPTRLPAPSLVRAWKEHRKAAYLVLLVIGSALLGFGAHAAFAHLRRGSSPPTVNVIQPGQPGASTR
jgi:serine/threonine protein kinase